MRRTNEADFEVEIMRGRRRRQLIGVVTGWRRQKSLISGRQRRLVGSVASCCCRCVAATSRYHGDVRKRKEHETADEAADVEHLQQRRRQTRLKRSCRTNLFQAIFFVNWIPILLKTFVVWIVSKIWRISKIGSTSAVMQRKTENHCKSKFHN